MLARPLTLEGAITRPFSDGDLMDTRERLTPLTTVGAGALTAAILSTGNVNRTGPVGGFTDTFDSAQNIVNAFSSNLNLAPAGVTFGNLYIPANVPQPGSSFRFLYINTVAQAMTAAVTANTGITLGTNVNIAASLWREYLISLLNTTQTSIAQATFSNVSAIVTGMTLAATNLITPGQTVASAGNVTAGTTVVSVQPGVGVTMSANGLAVATASASFLPTATVQGLRSGTA